MRRVVNAARNSHTPARAATTRPDGAASRRGPGRGAWAPCLPRRRRWQPTRAWRAGDEGLPPSSLRLDRAAIRHRHTEPGRQRGSPPGAARTDSPGRAGGTHPEAGRRPDGRGCGRDPRAAAHDPAAALRGRRAPVGRCRFPPRRARPHHRPPLEGRPGRRGRHVYIGRAATADLQAIRRPEAPPEARVFGFRSVRAVSDRIARAAKAARLVGRFSGHSPRVGMDPRPGGLPARDSPPSRSPDAGTPPRCQPKCARGELASKGAVARLHRED